MEHAEIGRCRDKDQNRTYDELARFVHPRWLDCQNVCSLSNSATPHPNQSIISSTQILETYDHLLLDTTTLLHNGSVPLALFSGSSFPVFLWLSAPEFSGQNAIKPSIDQCNNHTLQSLLAVPLYFCQSGVARRLILPVLDVKSIKNPDLAYLFSLLSAPPERKA
jgi:hypothetical protein